MCACNRLKNCAFVDYDNESAAAAAQSQMHRYATSNNYPPTRLEIEMHISCVLPQQNVLYEVESSALLLLTVC